MRRLLTPVALAALLLLASACDSAQEDANEAVDTVQSEAGEAGDTIQSEAGEAVEEATSDE